MNSLISSIGIVEEDTNDDVALVWSFPGINSETKKVHTHTHSDFLFRSSLRREQHTDRRSTLQGIRVVFLYLLQIRVDLHVQRIYWVGILGTSESSKIYSSNMLQDFQSREV